MNKDALDFEKTKFEEVIMLGVNGDDVTIVSSSVDGALIASVLSHALDRSIRDFVLSYKPKEKLH